MTPPPRCTLLDVDGMSTVSCPRLRACNGGARRLHPDPGPLLLPGGGLPPPPAPRVHRHRGAHTRTPAGGSERTQRRLPPARCSRTPGGRPRPGGGVLQPPPACRGAAPTSPSRPARRRHSSLARVPAVPTLLAKRCRRGAARDGVGGPAPGRRRAPGMRGGCRGS